MGYLVPLVLALVAIGVAEEGVGPWFDAPLYAFCLLPVPRILAAAALRLGLRGRFRGAAIVRSVLAVSGVLLHTVALFVFGWHAAVLRRFETDAGLAGWPDPALALSLLPFLVFELCAIDARARLFDPRPAAVRGYRSFQARLLVASLAPLALFGTLAWLVGRNERCRVALEEVGLLNAGFMVLLVVALLVLLPFFLRLAWSTRPLEPGWQRAVLEEVAARAGFRFRELLVWDTGGMIANAAIVGLHRFHRLVLFTDALLHRLPPRELAAVFGHEIGHARRWHVAIFGAWVIGFFAATHLIVERMDTLGEGLALALFGGLLVLGYLGFGYMSRRYELEADLESLAIVGDASALASALWMVTGRGGAQKSSWRHFSVARRVAFLQEVVADPGAGQRLKRRLRVWAWAGVALAAVAAVIQVRGLWERLGEDRVVVALRLGDYREADARAREVEELPAGLADLVDRAAFWGSDPGRDELAHSAREALAAGEGERALRDLELASLGGARDLEPVALALRDALEGRAEAALARLAELPDWRALVARQRPPPAPVP